jgi:ribosomal protein S18 acetylase RimI-like enzyme
MIELRPLSERDLDILHATMLDAFADYPIPMQPPLPAFELMLYRRGVVWPLSLGAWDQGQLIGYTLTARSGSLAYDVMTGIRRSAQGQGLVGRLFEGLWPLLHAEGIERMQLEVITSNLRAVRAYERLGFVRARRLICLKWPTPIAEVDPPAGVTIAETPTLDWPTWTRWWGSEPSWPSHIASAERSEPRVLEARCDGRACAVAIVAGTDLLQIAIAPEQRRRGIARALLASARPQRVLNVDERASDLLALLIDSGAQAFVEQFEMARALKTDACASPP